MPGNKLINATDNITVMRYYKQVSERLINPSTSLKNYGSVLQVLKDKKILCIHLLFHDNKFITNVKEKAKQFNFFVFKKMIYS